VDTNIYRNNGFRFHSQPLAAIADLRRRDIAHLIPEFWARELHRHTVAWAAARLDACRRELAIEAWATPAQVKAARKLHEELAGEQAESIAGRLIAEHYSATNAKQLNTVWASGPRVLDNYFAARFPFEATGSKKSEFQDAFALSTLESWGEKHSRQVLVVTGDDGCIAACAESKLLIGFETILEMLNALTEADAAQKKAASHLESFLAKELNSEVSAIRKDLDVLIASRLEQMEVDVVADSELDFIEEVEAVELITVHPAYGALPPDVTVLTMGSNELTFSWSFQADVDVSARFYRHQGSSRSTWGRYGAPSKHRSTTTDLEAIVTLHTAAPLSVEALEHSQVRSLDFTTRSLTVNFGEVEPWAEEHEE
jgi:hypothetical protein